MVNYLGNWYYVWKRQVDELYEMMYWDYSRIYHLLPVEQLQKDSYTKEELENMCVEVMVMDQTYPFEQKQPDDFKLIEVEEEYIKQAK